MFRQLPRLIPRQICRRSYHAVLPRIGYAPVARIRPIQTVNPLGIYRSFRTSARRNEQEATPLPSEDLTEAQWLDYLHGVSFSAAQSPKVLADLHKKNSEAGVFDAPNRMERAYALIFQLFLYMSRPQPDSTPEHWLQNFETLPSFDGDDLHLARLCTTHIIKTIVWEFEAIPQDDPQRIKYPSVFEDAHGLALLNSKYLEGHEGVPPKWSEFWSEAQAVLLVLGMDLGDAGYAIQAPPDPTETPNVDSSAPGLTRAQGFKGVDLTGNAGEPVRGAPNILETAQPGESVPDRIEMEFNANDKERPDQAEYWSKNPRKGGLF